MGGLLAGIGKAAMGAVQAFAGGGGGGGGEGGEGGGGADIGGIVKGVGELVTGIIGATKGGGEAKAAEGKGEGGEAKAAPKDPIAQLKTMLDKAKSPEEVDALVAKVADKLGKADPKVMQAVQALAEEKRLDLIAEGI